MLCRRVELRKQDGAAAGTFFCDSIRRESRQETPLFPVVSGLAVLLPHLPPPFAFGTESLPSFAAAFLTRRGGTGVRVGDRWCSQGTPARCQKVMSGKVWDVSTYVATESSLLGTGGITEGIVVFEGATKHAVVSEGGEGGR